MSEINFFGTMGVVLQVMQIQKHGDIFSIKFILISISNLATGKRKTSNKI